MPCLMCNMFFLQKFLNKVEEVFLCICCQEVVYQPITTECQHNVCRVRNFLCCRSWSPSYSSNTLKLNRAVRMQMHLMSRKLGIHWKAFLWISSHYMEPVRSCKTVEGYFPLVYISLCCSSGVTVVILNVMPDVVAFWSNDASIIHPHLKLSHSGEYRKPPS